MSMEILQATPSWSLSWYIQKYVPWILRIRKEGTKIGCCTPDEDVPQRRRHFVHGTRIRLWPPSRVEPIYPNDVSNRVIMEVVPCAYSEEEEEKEKEEIEEEEESIGKVEYSDKENIILETLQDPFHHHRRSEESIEYPSWNAHRQWDWSSDEEDVEGHSISVTALVHAEACFSDDKDEKTEVAIPPSLAMMSGAGRKRVGPGASLSLKHQRHTFSRTPKSQLFLDAPQPGQALKDPGFAHVIFVFLRRFRGVPQAQAPFSVAPKTHSEVLRPPLTSHMKV
nr:uncharacterized protein LOC110545576 [Meriones unguiculatus]